MIHSIFDRPNQHLKTWDPSGKLALTQTAEGDTWGYSPQSPYGFEGWMPPGHYVLGDVSLFDSPIASEGFGQIPILDMGRELANEIVTAGKAKWDGDLLVVGGIALPIGQLAKYDRSAIMVHCGGSNAADPYADYQTLCKTEGCTRMYNVDWRGYAKFLNDNRTGSIVVYTAIGNPVILPC